MAFRHGRYADVKVAGTLLSTFCETADFSVDMDTAETSTFQSTWKSFQGGLLGGKLDLSGFYDPTASTGPEAVLRGVIQGGTAVPIVVYPGGSASGHVSRTFNGFLTSYAESSPVGGVVSFKAAILATGAVTFATL